MHEILIKRSKSVFPLLCKCVCMCVCVCVCVCVYVCVCFFAFIPWKVFPKMVWGVFSTWAIFHMLFIGGDKMEHSKEYVFDFFLWNHCLTNYSIPSISFYFLIYVHIVYQTNLFFYTESFFTKQITDTFIFILNWLEIDSKRE